MKRRTVRLMIYFFTLFILFFGLNTSKAQNINLEKDIWKKISPYFNTPKVYQNNYGNYRSPLKFYNGKEVKSKQDWAIRKKEILDTWNKMMGSWPPLITNPNVEILETVKKDGYTQYCVSFKWTPNEKTKAYLSIPDAKNNKKMPAVITTYYEPETAIGLGKEDRDFAYQLTLRGFVTLSIGTTETSNARTFSIYYPSIQNAEVQPLSMLAYAAANSWYVLASLPQVDTDRVGVMGHSFGGKWAMFASCLFDKFACAVWSDPGIVFDESKNSVNYWEPWYLGYSPKPWRKRGVISQKNPAKGLYPTLMGQGYDLIELHALMAPRPFLVSGGSVDAQDRWIPLNHAIKVNDLLGYKNRVAMTNRLSHSPNPESNEQAFLFLEYFLKPSKSNR